MTRKSLLWTALMLLVVLLAAPLAGCNRSAAGDDVAQLEEQMNEEAAQNTGTEVTPQETAVAEPGTSEVTPEPAATTPAPETATETPSVVAPPTPTPVIVTEMPVPTSAPTTETPALPGTHVVQAGENLFRIALRYGISVDELARANNITNATVIYVGQVLTIPGGAAPVPPAAPTAPASGETLHVVQPGENLFRIALRYGLDYVYLASYNGITDPSLVYVGQQIKIPPR